MSLRTGPPHACAATESLHAERRADLIREPARCFM